MSNGQTVHAIVGLFPGQGAISVGAGLPWRRTSYWSYVEKISEATGVDVSRLLLDADLEEVVRTDNAQLATFALSVMGHAHYRSENAQPGWMLGHSLGEFSALVAAGVLDLIDGSRLIAARGAAMAKAATQQSGGMVAVMGGDPDSLERTLQIPEIWVANINGTGQTVLSGAIEAVNEVVSQSRELGWKRATPLAVGGAFHSPLMASAQEDLDNALAQATWNDTSVILVSNVDGAIHQRGDEWRNLLSRQMTSPVRFLECVNTLSNEVTTSVEFPPAGVLTGLVKRIRDFSSQQQIDAPEQLGEG